MSAAIKVTANTSNMYKTFTINQLPEVTMNLTHNSNVSVPTTLKALIVKTCIPPLKTFIPWTKPKCLKNQHTQNKKSQGFVQGSHQRTSFPLT
jgi:hypothetical protein